VVQTRAPPRGPCRIGTESYDVIAANCLVTSANALFDQLVDLALVFVITTPDHRSFRGRTHKA